MGIIMKDGRQYGVGGITPAENVTYDNTESGMTATDVQGALDELKNGLITVKQYTGTATTDVSGDFMLDTDIFTRDNSVILNIVGIRDAQGYSGYHTFTTGTPSNSNAWGFKVQNDSNANVGNTNIKYRVYYISL